MEPILCVTEKKWKYYQEIFKNITYIKEFLILDSKGNTYFILDLLYEKNQASALRFPMLKTSDSYSIIKRIDYSLQDLKNYYQQCLKFHKKDPSDPLIKRIEQLKLSTTLSQADSKQPVFNVALAHIFHVLRNTTIISTEKIQEIIEEHAICGISLQPPMIPVVSMLGSLYENDYISQVHDLLDPARGIREKWKIRFNPITIRSIHTQDEYSLIFNTGLMSIYVWLYCQQKKRKREEENQVDYLNLEKLLAWCDQNARAKYNPLRSHAFLKTPCSFFFKANYVDIFLISVLITFILFTTANIIPSLSADDRQKPAKDLLKQILSSLRTLNTITWLSGSLIKFLLEIGDRFLTFDVIDTHARDVIDTDTLQKMKQLIIGKETNPIIQADQKTLSVCKPHSPIHCGLTQTMRFFSFSHFIKKIQKIGNQYIGLPLASAHRL